MIAVVAAAVWARRPRWHHTPRFAAARTWSRPFETAYPTPGSDPLLDPLALLGGDHAAHVTVHGGPALRVRRALTNPAKETDHG